jgi:tRNA pseudouridine32 synthase/23S rRNA pseudouridine746 synthase
VLAAWPQALLVHRLDRDTSGVMVFGLTPHAQRFLSKQFELRAAKKTYVARVWGRMTPKTGRVDLPLIVDWPNRPRQHVDHENGKAAVTDWRVLKDTEAESRVRLMPKTGRSHQLRVHMLALGHPILGDPFYAKGSARDFDRLMLHSEELRIKHPDSGKMMRFRTTAPF